jgi:high-affinity nickel-transport protein
MAIPVRAGLTMEFAVGLMLILLGILNLTGVTRWLSEKFSPAHPQVIGEHVHIHGHGSHVHYHRHRHQPAEEHHGEALAAPGWLRGPFAKLGIFHSLRLLLIGVVHGLAGSAAVALLVLMTPRSALGRFLFAGFWRGDNCRDDADYRGPGAAVFMRARGLRG